MNLEARKLEFIQEFITLKNEETISQLEDILKKKNNKAEGEGFKPMTIEEFNSRIDQSIEDSKDGRLIESSELKSEIDKWN